MSSHTILGGAGTTTITLPVTGAGIGGGTGAGTGYSFSSGAVGATNTTFGYPNLSNVSYTTASPAFTVNTTTPSIQVKGDAEFEGDIKVQGKSLNAWMETMEKRLAILVPDPKKLEQYEALQKAYKNYKMLEALCEVREDEPK